ncbi:MAG: T9SS type A sorting domain-containing protein [Porphyromonadaceae bacterium]|nr:T9SS type A sorting domain-containing protein [Porphyromonadaceae bacterium]
MKKITLSVIFVGIFMWSFTFSDAQEYVWKGKQVDQTWSTAVANWQEGALPIPKAWVDDAKAIFDETAAEGSDTILIDGVIQTTGIAVNAKRPYLIRKTATTDMIKGEGTLVKDGTGDFVMDVENQLTGGSVVKNGRLAMEKQSSPNIFGSKILMEGGTVNFATSSSSSYPSIAVPMEFAAGTTSTVELSRYSYWNSEITGSGDILIKAGGERTYFGTKNNPPNLEGFTGKISVEKYVMSGVNPGFYGLILNTGKTYKDTTVLWGVDSTFYDKKLHLGQDIALTAESGNRCYAIGELTATDANNLLCGYYKASTTPKIYYMVGGLNTDVVFPGNFGDKGGKGYNSVGLFKVGTGTYTFTSNTDVSGTYGVEVREGRFYVNVDENELNKTALGRSKVNVLNIYEGAVGGGNGRLTGTVEVSGKLEIGYNGIGTIIVSDTIGAGGDVGNYNYPVRLNSTAVAEFEITSATKYDKLIVNDQIRFLPDTIEGVIHNPKIRVIPTSDFSIADGDQVELISFVKAKGATDTYDVEFVGFPAGVTWTYEEVELKDETEAVTGYKIIATAHGATGVKNLDLDSKISIYPNPSNGVFTISSKEYEIGKVEIFNIQGQLMNSRIVNSNSATISDINPGLYPVKITTSEGGHITKKVLVK